jgi:hypothetical protein
LWELELLGFEPELELERPLLLRLLVVLQKQLELQVVELLRQGQDLRLKPLRFEPELALELGLPRELLVRLELGRLVQLGLLPLVALRG